MDNDYFPLQAAVLSENALCDYIKINYFYENAAISCRLFWRSIHDVYRIIAGDKVYYYKLYKQGLRSYDEIQSEIDIINYLKLSGIKTVCPAAQKDGNYIGKFKTVFGERYGVLYESAGTRGLNEIGETDKVNYGLGKYIASIHTALDEYKKNYHRWDLDAKLFIDDSMVEIKRFHEVHNFYIEFIEDLAKKIKFKLNAVTKDKPEYGLCHGDFGSDNIRFDEAGDPVLFDFDFCGNGWRAYDIIYAYPFGLGYDPDKLKLREKRRAAFLEGYNKIRTMSAGEIDNLPVFALFRRIFNIGVLYVSYLHNTWGDALTINNIDGDINNIKKWPELNPVV